MVSVFSTDTEGLVTHTTAVHSTWTAVENGVPITQTSESIEIPPKMKTRKQMRGIRRAIEHRRRLYENDNSGLNIGPRNPSTVETTTGELNAVT